MATRLRASRSAAALLCGVLAAACQPQTNGAADTPARERPPRSIVLVTVDTLRADYLTHERMPALDALRSEAVEFTQAITTGPLTAPAHASLLTGLFPPRHGVRDNAIFTLPSTVPTYAERLKASGFATGAFVSAVVLDARYGLDRGFDTYDDELSGPERPAGETLDRALAWTAGQTGPFFTWAHLFEPHAPYRSGSYAAEVSAVDRALSVFFDGLRKAGKWDATIVSVTSDHGEALGDHGEATHGFFLYDATLRIPWIVKAPGLPALAWDEQVRIVDVMPTLAGLAGVHVNETASAGVHRDDGMDLSTRIGGPPARLGLEAYSETFLPRHQFGWQELRSLRTASWKFIEAPRPELYALPEDAGERDNRASTEVERVAHARRTLAAIERLGPPAATDPRRDASMLAERFMSLGYVGFAPLSETTSQGLADPKDKLPVYALVMRALELSEAGGKEQALDVLDRALALDAGVAQTHFIRGSILGDVGRFRDATAALERTLTINPRYVTARFKLALAWLRLGDHVRAERELERVLADEPGNVRAWHNLAAVAYTRGDLARVEELERQALAIDPSYAEAWNTLGAVFLVRKRPAEALDALSKAATLSPSNAQVHDNLALAYGALGQAADAARARSQACALDSKFCEKARQRP